MIILASSSPRRTEILTNANISHTIIPSSCEEIIEPNLKPFEVVESLSYQKAKDVSKKFPTDIIIGADTIVVINDQILGKPHSEIEAIKMLELISGKTHQVITGVTLIQNSKVKIFHEVTDVSVKKLTLDEIEEYIRVENVYDKAGSYAIQGVFKKYIKDIQGEYYNVVGLPIERLKKELEEF